jgi:hypothetical protein
MSQPECGYTQPVEIVVGGALPRNGYVQPVEIIAGSGMVIGLPVTGGTSGSVLFVDAAGNLGQNNAAFFWDNVNSRLGVGTSAPARPIHVYNTGGTVAPVVGYTNPQGTWHVGPFSNQDTWSIARSGIQAYMNIDGNTLANSDGNVAFNTSASSGLSATFRFEIRGAPVSTDVSKTPKLVYLNCISANSGDVGLGLAVQNVTGSFSGIVMTADPTSYFLQSFGNQSTSGAGADSIMEIATKSTGGNPYYRSLINSSTAWAWGANNGDSQKFYLCNNASGDLASGKYFVIDTSGHVGINTTTPRVMLDILNAGAQQLRLTYTDNTTYSFFQTLSTGNLNIQTTSGKVQIGAPGTPVIGNPLEVYVAGGAGITVRDTTNSREIILLTNSNGGNIGTSSNNHLLILTNTTQAAKFTNLQSAILGSTGLTTTSTDGFVYIPITAGAPTGVPTAQAGFGPVQLDSTNGKLWAYYGGAWHFAALT